ncbi:MAG: energy-coupling factor ABC transporter ATP-binding protein [Treponema sp.]|jgi:cobalt/nickel transport system ATP-binding protein|nr:energy-coupling factor ABC transporter ATP-binding protein [Treponema sp.]
MTSLVVSGLSYDYEDGFRALDNVTFEVQKGSCLCVAGANGSGKSTLLQLIAGCMKPAEGDIRMDGISIFRDKTKSSNTGIVFQEPDNQLFMPTVWEDAAFALLKKGMSIAGAKEAALAALKMVDAEYIAERPSYKLSGGEKQRAAIASVLSSFQGDITNKVILIDEPTASLDPLARKKLIAIIKQLSCTRIIATHDLDMALDICDAVLFLFKGKIVSDCTTAGSCSFSKNLLSDEQFLQSIGLELPLCKQKNL